MQRLKNRSWFCLGGRHAIENRIADFGPVLGAVDFFGMTAADIGAAEGDITQWIAERFATVEAHEYSPQLYQKLKKRFLNARNVTTWQTDITESPLIQNFDVVFFLGVLHCFTSETVRREALKHCLNHTNHLCIIRTAVRDFRLRDNRRIERSHRFTTLRTFLDMADEYEICFIDNGYRGTDGDRLGDLIVYRRNNSDNPLPTLDNLFVNTKGYLSKKDIEKVIICNPNA